MKRIILIPIDFSEALRALRKKYAQVKVQFRWEIFTGFTLTAL
jgi:hypothetical protein